MSAERERGQVDERDRTFIERFQQDVESDIRESARLRMTLAGRVLKIGVLILVVVVVVGLFGRHFHGFPFWWLFFGGGTGATLQAARAARERAAATLERADDPRVVGVLAGYAARRDRIVRRGATHGLLRVLPHVQANHAALISREGMDAMIHLLRDPEDDNLTISLLKAMEQVGDGRAVPAVEKLSKLLAFGRRAGRVPDTIDVVQEDDHYPGWEVRKAARECLPYLQVRAEQERLRSTLLRAVESPIDPGQTLLRPAANSDETPSKQLLRPAAEE